MVCIFFEKPRLFIIQWSKADFKSVHRHGDFQREAIASLPLRLTGGMSVSSLPPPPRIRMPDRVKLGIRGWERMIGSRRGSPPVEIFTGGRSLSLSLCQSPTVSLSSLSLACQEGIRKMGDKFKIPDKWARSDEEWRLSRWWGDIIKLPLLLVAGWGARRQMGEKERESERKTEKSVRLQIVICFSFLAE